MTVYCEGDRALLDEHGERSDLEIELLRQGFRHPDFALHVLRERRMPGPADGPSCYAVTVVNMRTDRHRIYRGGGRGHWVAEFARDLANGLFGTPEAGTNPGPDPAKRAA